LQNLIFGTHSREILLLTNVKREHARPIRSETRATLVASIARGRRWLDELMADATATADSIAKREQCSIRKVRQRACAGLAYPLKL
jgi:site-specific DNA recombinase